MKKILKAIWLPLLIFLAVLIIAPLNYYSWGNGDESTVYLAIGGFAIFCGVGFILRIKGIL